MRQESGGTEEEAGRRHESWARKQEGSQMDEPAGLRGKEGELVWNQLLRVDQGVIVGKNTHEDVNV